MNMTVRLYAGLAEEAGTREVSLLDLPPSITVGDLSSIVFDQFPTLGPMRDSVIFVVNAEYVPPDHPVLPGDEVALVPPVSGGSENTVDLLAITQKPLDVLAIQNLVSTDSSGAISIFVGVVRNTNQGRQVDHLEYDAYPTMAKKTMEQITSETHERWSINKIAMHHRIGKLDIGEASVVVAVSAPHRGEAIAACQYGINRLKAIVPIWKKEVWVDGEHWVEGSLTPKDEASLSQKSASFSP